MTRKSRERIRFDINVAKRLRRRMREAGVTVIQLANAVKVPVGTLRKNVDYGYSMALYNFARVCRALDLDANEILGLRRKEAGLKLARIKVTGLGEEYEVWVNPEYIMAVMPEERTVLLQGESEPAVLTEESFRLFEQNLKAGYFD